MIMKDENQESEEEQPKEEAPEKKEPIEDSELIKKLDEQEQRIDEKRKAMAKERLALNAQKREIEMSGRGLMTEHEEPKEETPKEYVDRLMKEGLSDAEKRRTGYIG